MNLQSQTITLLQADAFIKRTIRLLELFKSKDGEYISEAKVAQINMGVKKIT